MFSKYDVYTTVQSIYCYPDTDVLINRELERVFRNIHQQNLPNKKDRVNQIQNLSQTMAELNIIHPFREGNGRSIRELIRCMAIQYGLSLNWGNTDRETLINAAIAAVDDNMAFCDILEQCIEGYDL